MSAIEFETDVTSPFIRLEDYEKLKDQHVRVIVLSEHAPVDAVVKVNTAYVDHLRKRNFVVPANVDVDALMAEMNDGLS